MKERPILFSAPMVKAILAGKKTQTRRIAAIVDTPEHREIGVALPDPTRGWGRAKAGARLWVRETWALEELDEGERVVWRADRQAHWLNSVSNPFYLESAYEPKRWRPSIHMPRWAHRLDLEIAEVRCERLQDITEGDILAEGVTVDRAAEWTGIPWSNLPTLHHAWAALWDHINGGRASWASNPWVWAISFKRVRP